ncbi:MAG TPA: hypothetical protein VGD40_25295 [Chryseosolibacter sp.]
MLKYLDFCLQTMAIITPFMTDFLGLETPVFLAMLLGPTQLISCCISILKDAPLVTLKTIHLLLSIAFFVGFYFAVTMDLIQHNSVYHLTFPFMLAAFYYGLTIRWLFIKEHRKMLARMQ